MAIDPDGDLVIAQWTELPQGARVLSDPGSSFSVVIWVPKITQVGEFNVSVEAIDNGDPPLKGGASGRIKVEPAASVHGENRIQLLGGPHELAVGDFNGDGILDVAALSPGQYTLEIFLGGHEEGKANGTFFPLGQVFFSVDNGFDYFPYPTFARSLTISDLDGDGADDILVNHTIISSRLDQNGSFFIRGQVQWKAGEEPINTPSWAPVGPCAETLDNGSLARECWQTESLDIDQDGVTEILVTIGGQDTYNPELLTLRPEKDPSNSNSLIFQTIARQSVLFNYLEGFKENNGGFLLLTSEILFLEVCVCSRLVLWSIKNQALIKLQEWSAIENDLVMPLYIGLLGHEMDVIGIYRLGSGLLGVVIGKGNGKIELQPVELNLPQGSYIWNVAEGAFSSIDAMELAVSWSPFIWSDTNHHLSEEGELTIFQEVTSNSKIQLHPLRTIANTGAPHGIAAGDFNGDGLDDLAYTLRATDELVVWINPGDF